MVSTPTVSLKLVFRLLGGYRLGVDVEDGVTTAV